MRDNCSLPITKAKRFFALPRSPRQISSPYKKPEHAALISKDITSSGSSNAFCTRQAVEGNAYSGVVVATRITAISLLIYSDTSPGCASHATSPLLQSKDCSAALPATAFRSVCNVSAADSIAHFAASTARLTPVSSSQILRSRIPVRVRIHSSSVSTILLRSSFVNIFFGTARPVPTILIPFTFSSIPSFTVSGVILIRIARTFSDSSSFPAYRYRRYPDTSHSALLPEKMHSSWINGSAQIPASYPSHGCNAFLPE